MNIPTPILPHYERALPSGKLIKFRPFTVAEEMILLQAIESNDDKQIVISTYQIIKNCVVEPVDYNPDKEAWFDIDALILMLRAYSVNNEIEVEFLCQNIVDEKTCNEKFKVKYDIENLVYNSPDKVEDTIYLSDKIGVQMKYPTYKKMKESTKILDNTEQSVFLLMNSIKSVFDENAVYPFHELSDEEKKTWIENLSPRSMKEVLKFINSIPTVHLQKYENCPKCGYEHELRYDKFSDFFV